VIRWIALASLSLAVVGCTRQTTDAASRSVIVLGVDGMDPQFLEAHWDALPNLNKLRHEGGFRRLATTVPPQSPVAWSTVITGMDPGGAGIFDFIRRDPKTYMPLSSMAETRDAPRSLTIGPYLIPLSAGGVHTLRAGTAFWQLLANVHIPSTIIRMPVNFPPVDCEAQSLAGMGTPDMQGSFGTFTFFTNDPAEKHKQVAGGNIVHVGIENGRVILPVEGPPNGFRRDHAIAQATLTAYVDPAAPAARFDIDGQEIVLKQGEWSNWLTAKFHLLPVLKSDTGAFRLYLQQVHPYLRIYMSPVNIDPDNPSLPISTPADYSRTLAKALGRFYTQGIPEESGAFREGILNRVEYLEQSRQVLNDSLRMLKYQLDNFHGGLLFYYFSSIDQNSHMLWGKYDNDLLDIYRGVDKGIGEAMQQADKTGATLIVMSDHGFANFDRAVHLNTWLMREGFLTLDDPKNTSDDAGFPHVDWWKTQAYAVGLNGIFVNLDGRERNGIVSPADKQALVDKIAARLLAMRDPKNGRQVVDKVYFPEKVFRGRNLKESPDLFVGFRRGYRASWQTALGAVPRDTIDDNTDAWIGDHCMAADEVPGSLLSNRKLVLDHPQLYDIPATILKEFGVPKIPGMLGHSVF
jgi:predicted AlkP superfamily phosphohydrolase/phosphomutase